MNARNRRAAELRQREYLVKLALVSHLQQFEALQTISDPEKRYDAFRRASNLEAELEKVNASLTKQQRASLAQRDRAQKPRTRVTNDGPQLREIIADLMPPNPWEHSAKAYWLTFLERLKAMDLKPTTFASPHDRSKESVEYGPFDQRRLLSRRRFENIVSNIRHKSRETDMRRLS